MGLLSVAGYRVADANSYIVITGGGIDEVKIAKKALVMPWQRDNLISISPFDFEISLQAMTAEKLQVWLPSTLARPHNGMKPAHSRHSSVCQQSSLSDPTTNLLPS